MEIEQDPPESSAEPRGRSASPPAIVGGPSSPSRPPAPAGSWFERHASLIDLIIIAAVFIYNLPIQFAAIPEHLWTGTGLILSLGLCAPYILRRQHPVSVFLTILIVAVIQVALGIEPLVADLMLVLALYNLSSRHLWVVSVPATAAVIIFTVIATAGLLRSGYLNLGDIGVLIAVVVWAGTWGALVRFRRAHIESLHERARQLARQAEAQKQIVAAEERSRIAREIHDVVSHSLSVVTVLADGAATTVESHPDQAKRAMEDVRDTGRSAMTEMRSMLGVLRSDDQAGQAPQPGVEQLDRLIEESRAAGLPIAFEHRGRRDGLSEGLSLAVYRIVQEALTNIRKHAGASVRQVSVVLDQTHTNIDVWISDDGQGPAPERGSPHSEDSRRTDAGIAGPAGHGLVGMRERISAYGGTLETGSIDPHGFAVRARLPIGEGP